MQMCGSASTYIIEYECIILYCVVLSGCSWGTDVPMREQQHQCKKKQKKHCLFNLWASGSLTKNCGMKGAHMQQHDTNHLLLCESLLQGN